MRVPRLKWFQAARAAVRTGSWFTRHAALTAGAIATAGIVTIASMGSAGTMSGSMTINSDASMTTTAAVTINSSITNALEMRVGPPAAKVSIGDSHMLSIASDGTMWAWGYNYYSQLGYEGADSTIAVQVGTASDWSTATAAGQGSYAMNTSGTLFAWGQNAYGQVGSGTTTQTSVPTTVGAAGEWATFAAGTYQVAGIKKDGSLWAWGYNGWGQLGDGTYTQRNAPQRIGAANDWKAVFAGDYNIWAIKNDGSLWATGGNSYGQLGVGNTNNITTLTAVQPGTTWKFIASGGDSTIGIRTDGSLYSWGRGDWGQLGDATYSARTTPLLLNAGPFVSGSVADHIVVVKADGTMWSWGRNDYGQLGNGSTGFMSGVMSQIGVGMGSWSAPSAGSYASAAFANGRLYTWGLGASGILGDQSTSRYTPFPVNQDWGPYDPAKPWTLSSQDNTYTVQVWYRDAGGNVLQLADSIFYDATPPGGTNTVADGVTYINSTTVPIFNTINNVVDMRIGAGPWTAYASAATTVVASGDGTKTVSVTYRDEFGRTTQIDKYVYLDTAAPSGTLQVNGLDTVTRFRDAVALTTVSPDATAIRIEPPTGWTQVNMDAYSVLGIRSDGTLWGTGNDGTYSVFGDGYTDTAYSFRQVMDGWTWSSVALSERNGMGIRSDGSLWAWGNNDYGQIGDGTNTTRKLPSRVGAATNWKSVQVGAYTGAALTTANALYLWGQNTAGECGQGNWTSPQNSPVQVAGTWKTVALSGFSGSSVAAIKTDGTLWTWGRNDYGQVGDNTTTQKNVPLRPTGTSAYSDWSTVTVSPYATFAIRANGDLWAWGYNGNGQLGDGTKTQALLPKLIGTGYRAIAAGANHTLALKTDGSVWAWGYNGSGQLGDATKLDRLVPTRMGTRNDWVFVDAGYSVSMGQTSDGRLWSWGSNNPPMYADTSMVARTVPVSMDWFTYTPTFRFKLLAGNGLKTVKAYVRDAAGNEGLLTDTITLDSTSASGTVLVNGGAANTATATVSVANSVPNAVSMTIGAPVVSVNAGYDDTAFVRSDGVALMAGQNSYGRLGDLTTTTRNTPVFAMKRHDWVYVGTGQTNSGGMTSDGTVYAWGYGGAGGMGNGTWTDSNTPVQVGVTGQWSQLSVGYSHYLAIKKDGSLWGWGYNGAGSLGIGSYTNQWLPVAIASGSTWKYVSAGPFYNLGIKTDGSLWAWGNATTGQMGTASTTLLTPTRIGVATDWAQVSAGQTHAVGIKTDGSLWSWGDRTRYEMGDYTASGTPQYAPVMVLPGGIGWKSASAGEYYTLAVRADGTLWGWGKNNVGQVGNGYTWDVYPAQRIGTAADWSVVDAGAGFSIAAKADGTVWTFGSNSTSALGNGGPTTYQLSPGELMPKTWTAYATTATVVIDHPYRNVPVTLGFKDLAGNITWLSDGIDVDITPPVTTFSGYTSGWLNTATAPFTFTRTDDFAGFGSTFYRVNGSAATTWTSGNVFLSQQGTNTVSYWSVDAYGNAEAARNATMYWDSIAPVTTSTVSATWTANPSVSLIATDPVSGVLFSAYAIDANAAATYTGPLSIPQGVHTLAFRSTDGANNQEATSTVTARIDLSSPSSSASGIPAGWSPSDASITLSAADAYSGVREIRYRIDGGATQVYSAAITIGDGAHTLEWWAIDNVGNTEGIHSASVKVDTTVPVSSTDYDGLWHGSPVNVGLSAVDTRSGVATTYYRLNGGATFPYALPFPVSLEGTNTVEYWSVDQMGNREATKTASVLIDYTKPVTTISGEPSSVTSQAVALVLGTSDGGSGVANTYFRLNGGEQQPYRTGQTGIVVADEGTTTVSVWSVDGVGNAEAEHSVTFSIHFPKTISDHSMNPSCVSCHSAATGPRRVRLDFSAGAVDRATACPKCHEGGLAGQHPFHNKTSNCGAVCHQGWGEALLANIPNALTPYGAFATADSANLSSDDLHVIHSTARWESNADRPSSRCASCHSVAACEACHADTVDPIDAGTHAVHSATGNALYPARAPWSGQVGYGVPAGDQTQLTSAVEVRQCGTAGCHNTSGLKATDAVGREDFSHPADAATGVTTNTVNATGTWRTKYGIVYTLGRLSFSTLAGSTKSIDFDGQKVAVVVETGPNRGLADISIDGVYQTTIDCYSPTTVYRATIWTSPLMAKAVHNVTVTVRGEKNPSSTATDVFLDQFLVWASLPGKVAPFCSSCHADRVASHGYGDADHVADVGADIEPLSGAACTACHSMDLMTEHTRTGSSTAGKGCSACHETPRKTFTSWNQTCSQGGCHAPGTTKERHAGLPAAHKVTTAVSTSCTRNCHNGSLPGEHLKSSSARNTVTCVQCHNSTKYETIIRPTAWTGTCAQCHAGSHDPSSAGLQLCYDCHGASGQPTIDALRPGAYAATGGDHETGYATSAHGSAVPAGVNGGVDTGVQCEACHNHDAIGAGARTEFRVSGGRQTQAALCLQCHAASGDETRTPKPDDWNGRDLAVEFARPSTHPVVGTTGTVDSNMTTVTAFIQNTTEEFMADTHFQASALSTIGASLTWEPYTVPATLRQMLFMAPGKYMGAGTRTFSALDPTVQRWNWWNFNPADPTAGTGSYGMSSVVIDNELIWTVGAATRTRMRYTPPVGGTGDTWTALSDLPFNYDWATHATEDTAAGLVYYTAGMGDGSIYKWRYADDSWVGTITVTDSVSHGTIGFGRDNALAYSPETGKTYLAFKSWGSPGRVYWNANLASASGPTDFVNTGLALDDTWGGGSYGDTALRRFSRGGHDYLIYTGPSVNSNGYNRAYVIGGLASGSYVSVALPQYPFWSNSDTPQFAWDGGDYLYQSAETWPTTVVRIKIPSDPISGTWGAWEVMPAPPAGSGEDAGAAIGFLNAQTPDVPVVGYRTLGTISADVQLPAGATSWDKLEWTELEPYSTALSIKVEGFDGSGWVTMPGMGALASGPVDLSAIDSATYGKLRLTATLSTVETNLTPSLMRWSVSALRPEQSGGLLASLTCASCHNAHSVTAGGASAWDVARVSDPRTGKGTPASITDFCLGCHEVRGVERTMSTSKAVPYTVGFRAFDSLSFFPGWAKDAGGADFKSSGHYTTTGTKALCETCHDPHGSQNARLTAWTRPAGFLSGVSGVRDNTSSAAREQNLCFQCHGNGVTGVQAPGAQDIATPMSATYRHNPGTTGQHRDDETAADLAAKRHAECTDCHDPHAARGGTRINGAPVAPPALLGATGLKPTWDGTGWTAATGYTATRLIGRTGDVEALVCFKCHTGAAGRPLDVSSNGVTYTATDLALDFNPANASYHNVMGLSKGMRDTWTLGGVTFSWGLPADTDFLKPGWNHDSTVTCSDCHSASSVGQARGPHGSTSRYMLDPAYSDWKYSSIDWNSPTGVSGNPLCLKCHVFTKAANNVHSANAFLWGGNNAHSGAWCVSCHVAVPHGWKRPRLLGYSTVDPLPYRTQIYYGGSVALRAVKMRSHSSNGWQMSDCQDGCGGYTWGHDQPLSGPALP